jgi:multiple sugar transport system substrate-binding protein
MCLRASIRWKEKEMLQRKVTRRSFLKTAGAGVAGAALFGASACGGDTGQGGGGKITLTWWDYFEAANAEAVEAMHKRYMENNPNITIERRALPFAELKRTLLQGAGAGQLPDMVVIDNPDHQSFAELGVLEDLTDRIESWGEAGQYFEGPWNSTLWQGKNYGIPDNSNCLTLWYNQEFTNAAGVDPPANWDELVAAAEALTEGDRFGFAASAVQSEEGTFQWLPFLWEAGADIPNIDSEGGRAALGLWVGMVNEGWMSQGILGWTQEDVKNQFVNNQAAMMTNGPWQIPVIEEEAPDLKWNVVPLPEGEESASILGGENLAIISGKENVDAAWDLLTWWQRPENLKRYLIQSGKLPSRQDLAQDPHWSDDPVLGVFVEQLRVARARAYGPNYPEISSAIQDAIQAAISGESSVEEALSRAQEKITPLLPE